MRRALSSHAVAAQLSHNATFDMIRHEIAAEHARASAAAATVATKSPYESREAPWHWLDKELSSNVAGETGAVMIYAGATAALQWRERWIGAVDPGVLQFVQEHRAAEQSHLDLFEELIPAHKHTRLLPIWRIAGFTLGFLPTMVSERALFVTVEAVETFVDEHYHEQIHPLSQHGRCPELLSLLEHACADEVHHKDDAAARAGEGRTRVERAWGVVVRGGSVVAAEVARRV